MSMHHHYMLIVCIIIAVILSDNVHCVDSNHTASMPRGKQPRQYSGSAFSNYGAHSLLSNPTEALVVGVLAACGLSLFGMPLIMMLLNMFSMQSNSGLSLIPTATTNVNSGRRKRNANPWNQLQLSRVVDSFNTFLRSEEKMRLLQQLIA